MSDTIANALGVTVTITRSAGVDGAVLVLVDTDFEPDARDGGPGLRVLVNDRAVYAGVAYAATSDAASPYCTGGHS